MNSYQNELCNDVNNMSLSSSRGGGGAYQPPHLRANFNNTYANSPVANFNSYNGNRRYNNERNANGNGFQNYNSNGFQNPNGYQNRRGSRGGFSNYRGGYNSGFNSFRNVSADWSEQLPRNEALEKELFQAVSTGINFDDYDQIPVNISGPDFDVSVIKTHFAELNLHPILDQNIKSTSYTKPTPVQKYSIPVILSGRDLMACAQTGSGKTAAFLIPIFHNMFTEGPKDSVDRYVASNHRTHHPVCLVLAPTRELAMQIQVEAKKFAYRSNVRATVAYGGVDIRSQINDFNKGCNLLVATPGRLIDLLNRGIVSLSCCRYLILDEADRMLDLGFEPQIREIINSHLNECPRQTVMFSATFPHQIQMLAKDFLKDYMFLTVGRIGSTSDNITQSIHWIEEYEKRDALIEFLLESQDQLVLVFVEQKKSVDELQYFLRGQNFKVISMHGDKDQNERTAALESFRNRSTPILIATSVAARGLHIENISKVINFDLPNDIDDYVHRIGRTGRAGNTGEAISFCNDKNRNIIPGLVELLEEGGKEVPPWMRVYSNESGHKKSFGGNNRGRRGGGNFGSRDYRQTGRGGVSGGRGGHYNNCASDNYNQGGNVPFMSNSIDNWYKNF